MSPPYFASEHKDNHIRFWITAFVHKLDTHAVWSAKYHMQRDDGQIEQSNWLFQNYLCDVSILHEFIKRRLVLKAEKDVKEHILDDSWEELQETITASKSLFSVPLDENALNHNNEHRTPKSDIWFEVVIDSFTEDSVSFSMSVWGYKYLFSSASLPKQLYYIFADRLNAKIRFTHEWFALESVSKQLIYAMNNGSIFNCVKSDLDHELKLLRSPTEAQIQSSCRSIFPLLERVMRVYVEGSNSAKKTRTLDNLIQHFESHQIVSKDTIQLLRFAVKPKRDHIEHGRPLPLIIAKTVLLTTLEILVRLGKLANPEKVDRELSE